MALSLSEATRRARAKALMGGDDFVAPTGYKLALFTGDPNNGGTECAGTGYARITVTNEGATWAEVSGTFARNWRNAIDFVWSSAVGAGWGTPNWVCFYDSDNTTKLWAVQIDNAVTLIAGDPCRILTGALTVQFLN